MNNAQDDQDTSTQQNIQQITQIVGEKTIPLENTDQDTQNTPPPNPMANNPMQTITPNSKATLAYLLPPITGIALWVTEPNDTFVRFHAMQSILFGVFIVLLSYLLDLIFPFASSIETLVGFVFFIIWLLTMWNAYHGIEWHIPILGDVAKTQSLKQF